MKHSDQLRKIAATTALDGVAEAIRKVADEMDAEKPVGFKVSDDHVCVIEGCSFNRSKQIGSTGGLEASTTKAQMSDARIIELWNESTDIKYGHGWHENAKHFARLIEAEALGIPPKAKGGN